MHEHYVAMPFEPGKGYIARPANPATPVGFRIFPIEEARTVVEGMNMAYHEGWNDALKAAANAAGSLKR